MFLTLIQTGFLRIRFPRVSGDVSSHGMLRRINARFSPRERGCFSSLRLRVCRLLISPRTWGCFSSMHMKDMRLSFPHVSGEVCHIAATFSF